MGAYYLDSSALVKRYVQERGTGWVSTLTSVRSGHEIFVALVTGVEVVSAVARQARAGRFSPQDASAIIQAFQNHFSSQYRVVLTVPAIVQQAMDLAQRHGLRGYDAIQLASALAVQRELAAYGADPLVFVCSDHELNSVAQAEGLRVENPEMFV
jgi:predicted nucleic acid-binding protein